MKCKMQMFGIIGWMQQSFNIH